MKITSEMEKALNDQIALESAASNSYLAMATWCEVTGYNGAAGYFYAQSDEERAHMLKIVRHLAGVGSNPVIPPLETPPSSFGSLEDLVKAALKNEQAVTQSIHAMVDLARKQGAHWCYSLLEWFVDEQVQEETKFEDILQKFDLVGRDKLAICEIDKAMGTLATAPEQALGKTQIIP